MGSYFVNNEHYDLEFHRAMEEAYERLDSFKAAELHAEGYSNLIKLDPHSHVLLLTDINGRLHTTTSKARQMERGQ